MIVPLVRYNKPTDSLTTVIFNRVLPLAATHHARFVVVSSREYLSSSKFSEEDLEALRSGIKEEQAAVIAKLGQELAIFLSRFIKTHEIPKVSKRGDERLGGLAVMAWSLGCTTLLSFLSQVLEFSKELRDHLGEYLRTVVAYGEYSYRDLYDIELGLTYDHLLQITLYRRMASHRLQSSHYHPGEPRCRQKRGSRYSHITLAYTKPQCPTSKTSLSRIFSDAQTRNKQHSNKCPLKTMTW